MSVSIKVCVRCRPFTMGDKLGVVMSQTDEEVGEVNLINSQYSTNRFAFTYSWWSAYGYQRHVQDSPPEADAMELIDQSKAYDSCGLKIKEDLLGGNAVVLFAYGLSGSGKTFTVFGPDAVDIPEAWFKHATPHPLWGIFPRLAYDIFKLKEDGWKITMKYFQNVVDTVRDLMSPMAKEQQYKAGMKKDADGFTDIDWCQSTVLNSWDDLRKTFMAANARKAIAPTQFNHQSTRGHCIMTLEIEKPDPEREGMKQRGRVYVCDLAGTEPAGDIVYAQYEKVAFSNGDIEYKFLGAHPDASKSKELQDQGKKINLSLTEMSQFFMKMAEAVQKKKLKPGCSIPGCNSYFLCKYLKDTMLQARTYLFCAIRPEVTFHNYTFSTLGFAKNASVIKLQPKKATTAASPAERKLMAELEQMKLLVEQLKQANANAQLSSTGNNDDVERLNSLLQLKQAELQNHLSGMDSSNSQDDLMQRQRDEYAQRGISLTHYESETTMPYLINLDVDAYRSKRFMIIFSKDVTTVGSEGDVQLMSLTLVANHCSFLREQDKIYLVGCKGDTYHNGNRVLEGIRKELAPNDRVVIANELLLFQYPGKEDETQEEPTPDDAVKEYQKALSNADVKAQEALNEQLRHFEQEKAEWEKQKQLKKDELVNSSSLSSLDPLINEKEEEEIAKQVNDQELRDVLPKIQELTQIVKLLNRGFLSFETALQGSGNKQLPKVKVKVHNAQTEETIFLDVFEFTKAHAILKDELQFIRYALNNQREYTSPKAHDPITILFDNSFNIGKATSFPEYLLYNLETDLDESQLNIKLAVPPFNSIGKLQVLWKPLKKKKGKGQRKEQDGTEDGTVIAEDVTEDVTEDDEEDDVDDPKDLLRQSWSYELTIKSITGLPMIVDLAYCQYEFFGETFTTETVEQNTRSPVFDYHCVHHIECVTQQFIDYLMKERIEFYVYVSPYVMDQPKDEISSNNPFIVSNLGGTPVVKLSYQELDDKVKVLEKEKNKLKEEVLFLRQYLQKVMNSESPSLQETQKLEEFAKVTPRPKEQEQSKEQIELKQGKTVTDLNGIASGVCSPREVIKQALAVDAVINKSMDEA